MAKEASKKHRSPASRIGLTPPELARVQELTAKLDKLKAQAELIEMQAEYWRELALITRIRIDSAEKEINHLRGGQLMLPLGG